MIIPVDNIQIMKKPGHFLYCLCLSGSLITTSVIAQTWLDDSIRDFEELRLRQLETVQSSDNIDAFSTDGCSGFQSQNWAVLAQTFPGFKKQFGQNPPWESCCVAHDKVYWRGEVETGYTKRKQADKMLKQCIITTGHKMVPQLSLKYSVSTEQVHQAFSATAELMYRAVRLGGLPCSLLPWRWGYGWKNCAFSEISN